MKDARFFAVVVGLAVVIVLIGIGLSGFNPIGERVASPTDGSRPEVLKGHGSYRAHLPIPVVPRPLVPGEVPEGSAALWLPREKIEDYLTHHGRDAASLLAAFHASQDPDPTGDGLDPVTRFMRPKVGGVEYLKEAATNFPGDARVQRVVLTQNTFPEERRKWLDLFKTSSPDNSLANFLSAEDYFHNHQTAPALRELSEAAAKTQFNDFGLDIALNEEQLFAAAGKTLREAGSAGLNAELREVSPELHSLKQVAYSLNELEQEYKDANDPVSAYHVAELGMHLAGQLNAQDGTGLVIGQLVGLSCEALYLQVLDPNQPCDFLNGLTPAERHDQLNQQRESLLQMSQTLRTLAPTMTDDQWIGLAQRRKIYGQAEALKWLLQQLGNGAPLPESGR